MKCANRFRVEPGSKVKLVACRASRSAPKPRRNSTIGRPPSLSATTSSTRTPVPAAASTAPRSLSLPTSRRRPWARVRRAPACSAFVLVTKYFDHLPLYRQEALFKRQGLELSRSTTCDWMAGCARCLEPLYEVMKRAVLQFMVLWTDDTPVKLRGGDPEATKQSRLWMYRGDATHPYHVFDFTPNRQRDGPQTFLATYCGYLHADAFSGYDALYLPVGATGSARIHEVACNALDAS